MRPSVAPRRAHSTRAVVFGSTTLVDDADERVTPVPPARVIWVVLAWMNSDAVSPGDGRNPAEESNAFVGKVAVVAASALCSIKRVFTIDAAVYVTDPRDDVAKVFPPTTTLSRRISLLENSEPAAPLGGAAGTDSVRVNTNTPPAITSATSTPPRNLSIFIS